MGQPPFSSTVYQALVWVRSVGSRAACPLRTALVLRSVSQSAEHSLKESCRERSPPPGVAVSLPVCCSCSGTPPFDGVPGTGSCAGLVQPSLTPLALVRKTRTRQEVTGLDGVWVSNGVLFSVCIPVPLPEGSCRHAKWEFLTKAINKLRYSR